MIHKMFIIELKANKTEWQKEFIYISLSINNKMSKNIAWKS